MSEFPEVLHPEAARFVAESVTDPVILAAWLTRAVEEIEKLRAQTEHLIIAHHEAQCLAHGLEAKERLRKFIETRRT